MGMQRQKRREKFQAVSQVGNGMQQTRRRTRTHGVLALHLSTPLARELRSHCSLSLRRAGSILPQRVCARSAVSSRRHSSRLLLKRIGSTTLVGSSFRCALRRWRGAMHANQREIATVDLTSESADVAAIKLHSLDWRAHLLGAFVMDAGIRCLPSRFVQRSGFSAFT